MGTPAFAVPSLRAVARSCDVAAVVTQPDRPRGRGMHAAPSAVAEEAARLGLEVLRPGSAKTPEVERDLRALGADLFAVVAYGEILTKSLLAAPRLGAINLHASLLPRYRGASPVQRALWDGASGTGVTTMWIAEGLDTGDTILSRWTPIAPDDNAGSLGTKLADLGAPLLAESLLLALEGRAPRHPQSAEGASYARKLVKADGVLDWTLDPVTLWNQVRAVTPWPGATATHHGRRLLVTRAWPHHLLPTGAAPGSVLAVTADGVAVACGLGALWLARVKAEGRSEMDAAEWARGARVAPGERLASDRAAETESEV
jgi:methionyl-tRNA formyltransferase